MDQQPTPIVVTGPPGPGATSGVMKLLIPILIVGGVLFLIWKFFSKGLGLSKSPEAQLKMAEVREIRSESRATKREDRQDRKDLRSTIKSIRQEKRACKRATRGVRRKGGARRRAKAACNDRARAQIAAARQAFKDQEGLENEVNSGMGADGVDD